MEEIALSFAIVSVEHVTEQTETAVMIYVNLDGKAQTAIKVFHSPLSPCLSLIHGNKNQDVLCFFSCVCLTSFNFIATSNVRSDYYNFLDVNGCLCLKYFQLISKQSTCLTLTRRCAVQLSKIGTIKELELEILKKNI